MGTTTITQLPSGGPLQNTDVLPVVRNIGGTLTDVQVTASMLASITGLISQGANVTITGSGTQSQPYVINSTAAGAGGIAWNNVTGPTQGALVNNGYITNNSSLCTVTLPTTAAIGAVVAVAGNGAGGWVLAQNSGQTVHIGNQNTTAGAGGSLASTNRRDCVELVCVATNTDWVVRSVVGIITVT